MKEYRINHSDEIKEKRVKNSEEHKQYMKEYYKNNRSKILDDRCYQCNCDCGGKYRFYNKSKHLQSKKHLVFLNRETIWKIKLKKYIKIFKNIFINLI